MARTKDERESRLDAPRPLGRRLRAGRRGSTEDNFGVVAEQDRQVATAARADMEFLAREMASLRMALGEVATRDFVRSELKSLLADLDERDQGPDGDA